MPRYFAVLVVGGSLIATLLCSSGKLSPQYTLDLTTPVAEKWRGRSDMPGGGASWHTGQNANRFELPVAVRIIKSSVNEKDEIVVEFLLQNPSTSSLDIPIARDISRVEQTTAKSRTLFIVRAVPVYDGRLGGDSIGFGETAGSPDIEGSLLHLEPNSSIRVLLPVSTRDLKRSLPKDRDRVEVRIVCFQWQLDDQRYLITATSQDAVSANSVMLGLREDKPIVVEHPVAD